MHIWIDIDNLKHIPLAKAVLAELKQRGHSVTVTCEDEDKLKKELKNQDIIAQDVGVIVWFFGLFKQEIVMVRGLNLEKYIKPRNIDAAFSLGSLPMTYACFSNGNIPLILLLEKLEPKPDFVNLVIERGFFIVPEDIHDQTILEQGYDLNKIGKYKGSLNMTNPELKPVKEIVNQIEILSYRISKKLET